MAPPLNQEEENYMKLLKIIGSDVQPRLQQLFRDEFIKKFGWAYADDARSGTFFLNSILPKNMPNGSVKDAILNALRIGDSTQFDCSVLVYCFLKSKALLHQPRRPRNARVRPLNAYECVDELRDQRNKVSHNSNKDELSQTDFTTRVNELNAIYADLGWPVVDLQRCVTDPLETAECDRLRRDLLKEYRLLKGKPVQAISNTLVKTADVCMVVVNYFFDDSPL